MNKINELIPASLFTQFKTNNWIVYLIIILTFELFSNIVSGYYNQQSRDLQFCKAQIEAVNVKVEAQDQAISEMRMILKIKAGEVKGVATSSAKIVR